MSWKNKEKVAATAAISEDIRVASRETLCPFPSHQPRRASGAIRDRACLSSPDAGQPLIPLVEPDSVWLSRSFSPSLPLSLLHAALISLSPLLALGWEHRLSGGSSSALWSRQELPACGAWKKPLWQPREEREERASAAVCDPGIAAAPLPGEHIHTEVSPFSSFQVFLCRAGWRQVSAISPQSILLSILRETQVARG